jgi:hypothetical protein
MILRNKKKILNHLTEHGTICGTESLLKYFITPKELDSIYESLRWEEGLTIYKSREGVMGIDWEYVWIHSPCRSNHFEHNEEKCNSVRNGEFLK